MIGPLKALLRQKTLESFDYQWGHLTSGVALLSDGDFREDVVRILCEEEICIEPEWFRDKEVLDAGCGNGRWTYGLLKLGSKVTALDASATACDAVRRQFPAEPRLQVIQADLLALPDSITQRRFDLVFSWGVLHHTGNTELALKNLCRLVKMDGVIYVYLYGRESFHWLTRLKIGMARLLLLPFSPQAKKKILSYLYPTETLHNMFDILSPPINDRLTERQVQRWFAEAGFDQTLRTIQHTELFMKAWRSDSPVVQYFRQPQDSPYWFQRLSRPGAPISKDRDHP